jgi:sugar phosphate isomerase/epimerase
VTFRQLEPATIVDVCVGAGLDGIEWGGDVHAPPGDPTHAGRLRQHCFDNGIEIASYGSYACALTEAGDRTPTSLGPHDFDAALETALALGAPSIRVWPGSRPSAATDDRGRDRVITQLRTWAEQASEVGVSVSVEHHRDTLTDTAESAGRLQREVDHPNLYAYWQAADYFDDAGPDHLAELTALRQLLPDLSHLHVFWYRNWFDRWPLADGAVLWPAALALTTETGRWPHDRYALLEFVRDDNPASLREDADALRTWLGVTTKERR